MSYYNCTYGRFYGSTVRPSLLHTWWENNYDGIILQSTINNSIHEIPVLLLESLKCKIPKNQKVILPLIHIIQGDVCATSTTFIRHIANRYYLKNLNFKGTIYYTGNGIILDSSYRPLVMSTVVFDKDNIPLKYKVYLNPIVFSEDTTLNKYLRNKFFKEEILAESHVYENLAIWNACDSHCIPHEVVMKSAKEFIVKPATPKANNINEEINDFLIQNIDSIV